MFDRDELGVDPEEDEDDEELCEVCGLPWEDCECDEEEEECLNLYGAP